MPGFQAQGVVDPPCGGCWPCALSGMNICLTEGTLSTGVKTVVHGRGGAHRLGYQLASGASIRGQSVVAWLWRSRCSAYVRRHMLSLSLEAG